MINETRMTSQFYLDQIKQLDNPELNKPKIRSLIENAIVECNNNSDFYWIRALLL
jgi:hypothetical protein